MHNDHRQTERTPIFNHHRQPKQQFTEYLKFGYNILNIFKIIHEFKTIKMVVHQILSPL